MIRVPATPRGFTLPSSPGYDASLTRHLCQQTCQSRQRREVSLQRSLISAFDRAKKSESRLPPETHGVVDERKGEQVSLPGERG
jgi:hypothetical protein